VKTILGTLVTIAAVALVSLGLLLIQPSPPTDSDGIISIGTGTLCPIQPAGACQPVSLPYSFTDYTQVKEAVLTFTFQRTDVNSDVVSVYMPSVSDNVSLHINGWAFTAPDEISHPYPPRHWNYPFHRIVPQGILTSGQNTLVVGLFAEADRSLILNSIQIGDAEALRIQSQYMLIYRVGLSRIAFAVAFVSSMGLLVFWMFRRHEVIFLWMGAAAASTSVYALHWTRFDSQIGLQLETGLTSIAMVMQTYCAMRFTSISLNVPIKFVTRITGLWVLVASALMIISPDFFTLFAVHIVTIALAIIALGQIFTLRHFWTAVFWFLMVTIVSIFLLSGFARTFAPSLVPFGLAQSAPVLLVTSIVGILLAELARALHRSEAMTRDLSAQIAEKSIELAESYRRMQSLNRERAVAEERQRIMLDLHDGVGGQLVNSLAYIEASETQDTTLRDALEEALRDLSLMVDSLTPSGDIAVLLGMLRGRLQPLLAQNGLIFDWQIEDEPEIPDPGPSQNLRLMRIVQEAVTNIVKHANARTITVRSDSTSVFIGDDGDGFDVDAVLANPTRVGGFGLPGMHRRANALGAHFSIKSDERGTMLCLDWTLASTSPVIDDSQYPL